MEYLSGSNGIEWINAEKIADKQKKTHPVLTQMHQKSHFETAFKHSRVELFFALMFGKYFGVDAKFVILLV